MKFPKPLVFLRAVFNVFCEEDLGCIITEANIAFIEARHEKNGVRASYAFGRRWFEIFGYGWITLLFLGALSFASTQFGIPKVETNSSKQNTWIHDPRWTSQIWLLRKLLPDTLLLLIAYSGWWRLHWNVGLQICDSRNQKQEQKKDAEDYLSFVLPENRIIARGFSQSWTAYSFQLFLWIIVCGKLWRIDFFRPPQQKNFEVINEIDNLMLQEPILHQLNQTVVVFCVSLQWPRGTIERKGKERRMRTEGHMCRLFEFQHSKIESYSQIYQLFL